MSGLARLQAQLQAYLLDQGQPPPVVGDARAPAGERLAVYHQAYRLRLVQVLRQDFAGVAALAGDEDFTALAHAYLAAHPSRQPSVRGFGHALADFLAGDERWRRRAELAEMARFEWAWGEAFDAPDAATAAPGDLARVPGDAWAELQVQLQPALRQLRLHFNVPAVFGAVTREESLPALTRTADTVAWCLWRHELVVRWRSVAPDEAWALTAAAAGESFAALCEGLCSWHAAEAVPGRAAGLLQQWLADGLVTRLQPGPPG